MNKKHGANCVVCLGFIDFRLETFVKTHDQYYHVKCFQSPLCANPLCGKKITKGLVVKVLSTRAFSPRVLFRSTNILVQKRLGIKDASAVTNVEDPSRKVDTLPSTTGLTATTALPKRTRSSTRTQKRTTSAGCIPAARPSSMPFNRSALPLPNTSNLCFDHFISLLLT